MRQGFLCLLFFLVTIQAFSQLPVYQWAHQVGDLARALTVDDDGNVYSVGFYSGSKDFDPGPGTYNLNGSTSYLYIHKLTAAGNFVWAKSINISVAAPISLFLDKNKDLIICFNLTGTVDLDPGPGIYNFSSVTQSTVLMKFTRDGNFVWCKTLDGTATDSGITTGFAGEDKDGNIILIGSFYSEIDFDPGPGTFKMSSVKPDPIQFIAKFTTDGDFIWAKTTARSPYIDLNAGKCDKAGNIYVMGGTGYVDKYDSNGNKLWAIQQKLSPIGNGVLVFYDMTVDANGNTYYTGRFDGTMDFDPGTGNYIMKCAGGMEGFVVKMDPNGHFVWAKHFGGSPGTGGQNTSITVDAQANIYTVGAFIGTGADFDPGSAVFANFSFSSTAVVLEKLDSDGNFIYASALDNGQNGYSEQAKVVVDLATGIYIIGQFNGTVDFDPGTGVKTLTTQNAVSFILKLAKCLNPTSSVLSITACGDYILNNHIYNSSGTYTQVISNAANCDSTITLNLVINRKVFKQTISICEGSSYRAGGAQQTKPGMYYDTVKTLAGCDSVIITELIASQRPKASFQVSAPAFCQDQQVFFTDLSDGMGFPITSYHWGFAKGDSSFSQNPIHSFHDTGIISISLYFINSNGCVSDTLIKQVIINPYPQLIMGNGQGVLQGGTIIIQPKYYYGNGLTFLWSPSTYLDSNTIVAPHASPQENITYKLTLTGVGSCSVTDTISVTVLKTPVIPNVFSPNGDGINDTWKIQYLESYPDADIQVYDRNGQIIYRSKGYSREWDGTFNGKTLPVGTYYYMINPKNGRSVLSGSITIIK